MRRRLPAGVRMYTGDDFNYAELIAGDDEGHSDALLGIFDAIAPAASAALAALGRGSDERVLRHPRADRPALAPHLQGADPLLQDRRRLPRLPQRPAGPFRHGRRPAERPLAPAPRRAVPPRRQGRRPRRPRPGRRPDEGASSPSTASPDGTIVRACRSTSPPSAPSGTWRKPSTAASATASPPSRPGATRSPPSASTDAARIVRDNGLRVTGLCRGGLFPAADRRGPPRRHRRQPPRHRRGRRPRRRLPRPRRRRPARGSPRPPRRPPDGPRRHRRHPAPRPRRRRPARHRAAAPDVRRRPRLREHPRQALDLCDALGPGTGAAIDVYHVWWDPDLEPQLARAGAAGQILAHHICDWLVPTTRPAQRPRHDGRRRHRPPAHPPRIRGRRLTAAPRRSRSSPPRTGGSATATRCSRPASSGSARSADPFPAIRHR